MRKANITELRSHLPSYLYKVTLSAIPEAGAIFNGWSGGGCAGAGDCTITL